MKVQLSESGPELSRIVAGVMNWGIWGADLDTAAMAKMIEGCVDIGVSSFDHADIYGGYTTERAFGKAFKETGIKREEVELVTKCGICYPCDERPEFILKSYNTTKDYIIQAAEKSLDHLQTDYIDVLLIHRPSPIMYVEEMAAAFSELQNSGKVRHFGVSNFTASQMNLLQAEVSMVTNQVEASLIHLDPYTDGTFDGCQQHGMHPMIWSPLGGGKLFELASEYDFVNRRARIVGVCEKYGWELDEACYLFLLHHPFKLLPVTGSSKIDRIKTAVDAVSKTISNDQWFELWTASTGVKVP